MVQILVKLKDDASCIEEWAIIEVQGDIECSSDCPAGNKFVGHLIHTPKERPILIIGYHILYGKIVDNNPAIAVLKRQRKSDDETSVESGSGKTSTDYELLALVKKKLVFKTRPKPIVTSN